MRLSLLYLFVLLLVSCQEVTSNYNEVILENDTINTEFLKTINDPEKALLSWYLYAYGNACRNESLKVKCQLLKEMNINDECEPSHLNNLLQWLSNDMLAAYKLKNCPNIPMDSPIQNDFEYIGLIKNADTLSIQYSIKGMHTTQEKSWNINQTDSYLIIEHNFVKLKPNE